jgi:hypothetical protein
MRWAITAWVLGACSFSGSSATPSDAPGQSDANTSAPDAPPVSNDGGPPDAIGIPDATLVDATPAYDRELCPPEYTFSITGYDTSYYRPILTLGTFATHHADCNDDTGLGWTHLVVPDANEAAAWGGTFASNQYFYIGAVQDPAATTLAGGWFQFDGGPITAPWSSSGLLQPNDDNFSENGRENLALSTSAGTLHDVRGLSTYFAVCECDGTPISPAIVAMLPL